MERAAAHYDRQPIRDESDLVVARRRARELAIAQGLSEVAVEALATAVSEVGWNIIVHAGNGELLFGAIANAAGRGVVVIARDAGPGIADIQQAMQDGYSTKSGLGDGLPGARRLVDEFEIESRPGVGTTVTLRKWERAQGGTP